MLVNVLSLIFFSEIYSLPSEYLRGIAESNRFDDFDNYPPKFDDFPNFDFPTNYIDDDLPSKNSSKETTTKSSENSMTEITIRTTPFPKSMVIPTAKSHLSNETNSGRNNNETTFNGDVEFLFNFTNTTGSFDKLPRQQLNETDDNDPEFPTDGAEAQESGEENDGNMLTGLISAFLGGLSRPDGGIDLEAIVGLLGSLSTQNQDGTYDFQGLTDLLGGLLGGGGDGGGSDVGSFVGGLLGAVIKGVAYPPGPKGAGIVTGKIVTGILPALSGPVDTDMKNGTAHNGLESGSFLSGLLKPILASSGGQNEGIKGNIFGLVTNLVKFLIRSLTKLVSASSSSSSSNGH